MTIRDLTRGDVDALREIDRVSFDTDDQYDTPYYEEAIASDGFDTIGALDEDGNPIAWVLVDLSRRPIRIRSLSVHPDVRRRGVGTALVLTVFERHGSPIDLLVAPANSEAIALYRTLGFSVVDPDPELPHKVRMLR